MPLTCRELELKYEGRYAPIFVERAEVVSGAKAVEGEPTAEPDNGIPTFWLQVLQRSEFVKESITDKDAEVLAYLTVRRVNWGKMHGTNTSRNKALAWK